MPAAPQNDKASANSLVEDQENSLISANSTNFAKLSAGKFDENVTIKGKLNFISSPNGAKTILTSNRRVLADKTPNNGNIEEEKINYKLTL